MRASRPAGIFDMIRSMTSFARVERPVTGGSACWELRSVNHRYLEVSLRLPETLRGLEQAVRERIGAQLSRGKVDAQLRLAGESAENQSLRIDEARVRDLAAALAQIAPVVGNVTPPDALDLLRWPGVVILPKEDPEGLQATVLAALDQALAEMNATREREGRKLAETIEQRCAAMEAQAGSARERLPEALARLRQRLRSRLEELRAELDPARLEQEIALVAQRMDVDEELDRLETHLGEVRRVLRQNQPVGRRLDFLMQELHREANTLGSKSQDIETTRVSVELKVLIEQMREQVQNIE